MSEITVSKINEKAVNEIVLAQLGRDEDIWGSIKSGKLSILGKYESRTHTKDEEIVRGVLPSQ